MKLYDTLTDLLAAARERDRHIRFIDGENATSTLAFADLWDRAAALLGALQRKGMQAGDELVIYCASNERFLVAFWAAILGGLVPVPVAVGASDEHRLKLFRILSQLQSGTLFTDRAQLERLTVFAAARGLDAVQTQLSQRSVLSGDVEPGAHGELHPAAPADLAFIQYSSGSTSDPKGICLTHANLCTNIRAIVEGAGWNETERSLSWMPLTHDMGLIGFHLSVLAAGMDHAIMDTQLFVRRPLLWMSEAYRFKATQLCSPNFGYKHFLKLFERKGLPDGTDLSAIKAVMNGAEPISWDLCEAFLDALAPLGLHRDAMFPVYGLAEATVGVSLGQPGTPYSRVTLDRHRLAIGDAVVPRPPDTPGSVSFVKVGRAMRDVDIRIADDADARLVDGHVGHIQLRGGSVTERVHGDPVATAELFTADGWLRTGDCGLFVNDELVITGRQKDLIIVNGQNYYPHDIEEIAAEVDGLELGKVVVGSATPAGAQTEELLVFLLYRQATDRFHALADRVRDAIGEHAGLEVEHVIPVARIPKTTSGKVQRARLLQDYLDGAFDQVLAELATDSGPDADVADDADPLVAELATIARQFSKERHIGPDENLFEVGLSSLTLTEFVLAVDERHPGKLDISDLFDVPTLRQIADFLRSKA